MASFVKDRNKAVDGGLLHTFGQSRSEIMLAVWKGTGSDGIHRKLTDQGCPPDFGKVCGPTISGPFRWQEMKDGQCAEVGNSKCYLFCSNPVC